ncbi:UNVERIFIED_CONTAM: hypothetical protein HHA_283882 [Hammondia hammondi]|eukprot:XP_008888046.1 hypothetical protein HHA_283882 [Hammondia hammondi]
MRRSRFWHCVALFLLVSRSRTFFSRPDASFFVAAMPAPVAFNHSPVPHVGRPPHSDSRIPVERTLPTPKSGISKGTSSQKSCQNGETKEKWGEQQVVVSGPPPVNTDPATTANSREKPCRCSCCENRSHDAPRVRFTMPKKSNFTEEETEKSGLHASLRRLPDSEEGQAEGVSPGHRSRPTSQNDKEAALRTAETRVPQQSPSRGSRAFTPQHVKEVEQAVLFVPITKLVPFFVTPAQQWSADHLAAMMMGGGSLFAFRGFEPLY